MMQPHLQTLESDRDNRAWIRGRPTDDNDLIQIVADAGQLYIGLCTQSLDMDETTPSRNKGIGLSLLATKTIIRFSLLIALGNKSFIIREKTRTSLIHVWTLRICQAKLKLYRAKISDCDKPSTRRIDVANRR